jgi:putative membrane protein
LSGVGAQIGAGGDGSKRAATTAEPLSPPSIAEARGDQVQEIPMILKLLPALALASGLALATAACNSNNDDNDNPGGVNSTATADTGPTEAAPPANGADHAAQFLTDAIMSDNAEIKAGQAAQDMGLTQAVKDYGKTLVADHTKAKDQASAVAKAMNVPIPTGTPPEADSGLKMAMSMSGAGFDKDFLAMMVKDHQAAIDKFQQEAASTDPAQVTDLAKQSLPTLKKHLETAQSLQK